MGGLFDFRISGGGWRAERREQTRKRVTFYSCIVRGGEKADLRMSANM